MFSLSLLLFLKGVKNNQCFSLTAGTKVLAAAVDNPADCGAIFQAIQHLLGCGKDKLSQDKKMATDGSVIHSQTSSF